MALGILVRNSVMCCRIVNNFKINIYGIACHQCGPLNFFKLICDVLFTMYTFTEFYLSTTSEVFGLMLLFNSSFRSLNLLFWGKKGDIRDFSKRYMYM